MLARLFHSVRKQSDGRLIRLNAAKPTRQRHPKNLVRNTKYTVLTFLPKVLYEQFKYF